MSAESSDGAVSSSFTDLMTSLAVIFILLFVAILNNQGEARKQKQEENRNLVVTDLKRKLDEFLAEGVKVEKDLTDPASILIITPEDRLHFRLDDAHISPKGEKFLEDFAPKLVGAVVAQVEQKNIVALIVEGHTDATGTDKRNLPLSQERATAVSLHILKVLDERAPELKPKFVSIQSTAGRGSAEPMSVKADGNGEDEMNRRVVFKIRLRSIEGAEAILSLGATATPPTNGR